MKIRSDDVLKAKWCYLSTFIPQKNHSLRLYVSLQKMEIWFLALIQGGREPDSRWVFNTLSKDFEIKLFDVFGFFFTAAHFSLQAVQLKTTMIHQQTRCLPDSWAAASVRVFSAQSHELPWPAGETFNQPFSRQLEVNVNGKKNILTLREIRLILSPHSAFFFFFLFYTRIWNCGGN